MNKEIERNYTSILKQELQTAMGCTEPIAIAYCAAYAKKLLGRMPEHCTICCSGNVIKNVKAVTVPQTGGLKGIRAATLAGLVGGNADRRLEVLSDITDADRKEISRLMDTELVTVSVLESVHPLHIIVQLQACCDSVSVEIVDSHTGIGDVIKNGRTLHTREAVCKQQEDSEYGTLNIADILAYADSVDLTKVRDALENQIACNQAIAKEGLENHWGAAVGTTLLARRPEDVRVVAEAMAAAGSDARMNGCPMPVVINSGSGNQGLTVSLPVIVYAEAQHMPHEKLLRALCVSNLAAIRQKAEIGKLSAFCGAVSAAAGAVAGVAYLDGQAYDVIAQTITNAIACIGGMVCDGAKSSCAGKIATALECAFLGYDMAQTGHGYHSGEGIVMGNVEETIECVGSMARNGMRSTDQEILRLMV